MGCDEVNVVEQPLTSNLKGPQAIGHQLLAHVSNLSCPRTQVGLRRGHMEAHGHQRQCIIDVAQGNHCRLANP